MTAPGFIAIGADGSAYVADTGNNRIDVFSPLGAFLFAFGKEVNVKDNSDVCTADSGCKAGAGVAAAGAIDRPEGIDVAPNGSLYVGDLDNDRIDVYSAQGAFLFAFGKEVNPGDKKSGTCTAASGCIGGKGDHSAGDIDEPRGLGFGAGGEVYVADSGAHRIDVFSPQGAFLFAFGKEVNVTDTDVCTAESGCKSGQIGTGAGALTRPFDVKAGPDGKLAVSDQENSRIDVYSAQGAFLYAFGKEVNVEDKKSDVCTLISGCKAGSSSAVAGALGGPNAIEVDAGGAVYIADALNQRIAQFTFAGGFVRAFGESVVSAEEAFQICDLGTGCQSGGGGTIPGAIPNPFGVAVDCRGAIYAVEEKSNPVFARVERFAEPGTAAPPCPQGATPPSNQSGFKLGKLKLNRKKGTATLVVAVPGPGALVLKGRGIRKVERSPAKAGNVTLPVKLVGKAKRKLLNTGRSTVKAKVTFTPTGGAALTQPRSLTLKKTLRQRAPKGSR